MISVIRKFFGNWKKTSKLVGFVLVGMMAGSLLTGQAQAFVFGSQRQVSQWVQAGANLIGLRNETNNLRIGDDGNLYVDTTTGRVGIGTILPTAALHLKGGTTGANTAPLKFTAGSNLDTAEAGAMEFDGTNLYFTPAELRKTIAFTDSNITGNAATATNLTGLTATIANLNSVTGLLDTAAFTAGSDYATAAQGTLAANALPASSFTDAAVTGKLITGYSSGSGTVAATDTILQAINKLNGNDALKAPLANPTFTGSVTMPGTGIWNSSGNVGIGTTSPGAPLEVANAATGDIAIFSTAAGTDRFKISADTSDSNLSGQSGNNLKLGTSGSGTSLTILNNNGNIGIGTTNPGLPLQVNRNSATTDAVWNAAYLVSVKTTSMADGFGTGIRFRIQDDAAVENTIAEISAVRDGADNSGKIQFTPHSAGANSIGMVIDHSGNVGIGTTNPGGLLHLYSTTAANDNPQFIIENLPGSGSYSPSMLFKGVSATSPTISRDVAKIYAGFTTGNAWADANILFQTPNSVGTLTDRVIIRGDTGNIGIGTTSPEEALEVNGNIITTADGSLPHIVLDSTSSGDNWTAQGAYISIGENGALGSASMHLTYTGDGFGYSGAGTVATGIPAGGYWRYAYNSQAIYTPASVSIGSLTLGGTAISATAAELNILDGVTGLTAAELTNLGGVTATATELNYVDGVTSAIQTQLGLKAPLASPTFTGTVVIPSPFTLGATSVTATGAELNILDGVTGLTAAELTNLGGVTATATELNYVDGVTSAIQTQLGLKAPLASPTFTGTVVIPSPFTLGATSVTATGAELNKLDGVTATATELNYVDGVTSAIQTQLGLKAPLASPTFTGSVTMPGTGIWNSSGSVGIGITTPMANFDIAGTGGLVVASEANLDPGSNFNLVPLRNSGRLLLGWNRTGGGGETDLISNMVGGSPGGFNFYEYSDAGTLTHLVTFLGTGNVGIGMTDPSYQLQLSTNSAAKPTHNVWTIASDARIKTDISNFTDGLETVLKIRPTIYKYNGLGGVGFTDTESHIGVIAQEVELVAPYMVETGKGQIGGITVNDFKSYQGHALPFILVNAIKEQQGQIEELKLSLDNLGLINSTSTKANLSNAANPFQWLTTGLQTLGVTLSDGIANLKEVVASKFSGGEANIGKVQSEQITTRQMCVAGTDGETICLTKDQLKSLLDKNGIDRSVIVTAAPEATLPSENESNIINSTTTAATPENPTATTTVPESKETITEATPEVKATPQAETMPETEITPENASSTNDSQNQ
jgi:hypothetical protein